MEFEFDEQKAKRTRGNMAWILSKRRSLWDDPELLEIPLESEDEQRLLVIGLVDSKHWTAIITYRQTRVRIISVRRSRDDERELYES